MENILIDGQPYLENRLIGKDCESILAQSYLLAVQIFSLREKMLLQRGLHRLFPAFSSAEYPPLVERAVLLMTEDLFHDPHYSGPCRLQNLSLLLQQELAQWSVFSVEGFCRFRLPGYGQYLTGMLRCAADSLLADAEQAEYIALLQSRLQCPNGASGGELHVFLQKGSVYHICTVSQGRLFPLEGGRLQGFEDILITNLLNLCPARLVVHTGAQAEPPVLPRLREIFSAKLEVST